MSYGKVHDAYWESETIDSLSDRAALLGLFLISGKHRNAIGCFKIGIGAITDEPRFGKWGIEGVSNALRELSEGGFIARDDRTGWTFIVNALKHDPIKGYKAAAHAVGLFLAIPKNLSFHSELSRKLSASIEAAKAEAKEWKEPKGYPFDTPSIPQPSPLPSPEPYPLPEPQPPAARNLEEGFEGFWEVYPLKADEPKARKAYIAARKAGASVEEITAGAVRYRDDPGRKPEFTQKPHNWLAGKGWSARPAEPPPKPGELSADEKEANRLATLVWAIEQKKPNIANNYSPADVRKLIASGRVSQEQVRAAGAPT